MWLWVLGFWLTVHFQSLRTVHIQSFWTVHFQCFGPSTINLLDRPLSVERPSTFQRLDLPISQIWTVHFHPHSKNGLKWRILVVDWRKIFVWLVFEESSQIQWKMEFFWKSSKDKSLSWFCFIEWTSFYNWRYWKLWRSLDENRNLEHFEITLWNRIDVAWTSPVDC